MPPDSAAALPRLVLDTNVWLDWLVFDDPGIVRLRAAVGAGRVLVFADAAGEEELARVLARALRKGPPADAATRAACLAAMRRASRQADGLRRHACLLPACRDPDDQKFLELARECGADVLVTKDLALLELAGRRSRPLPFRILTPLALEPELPM